MILKVIQWNIGGAKIRKVSDNATIDGCYINDNIEYICNVLKKYNADIITLQETHFSDKENQVENIASSLGLNYFVNDVYDESHLEKGQSLGQSIISRFSIRNHSFIFFNNPQLKVVRPNGEEWKSHNKGVSKCYITIDGEKEIEIETLHLIPFRKFGIDPLNHNFDVLRQNISECVRPRIDSFILQGDFNFDNVSLKQFLPDLILENGVSEVLLNDATTPKGRNYDHIIFRGAKHIKSKVVVDVLTDHYPVYSEFEFK